MSEEFKDYNNMEDLVKEVGPEIAALIMQRLRDYRAGDGAETTPPGQGRARLKRIERVSTARGECLRLTWETIAGQRVQQLVDLNNGSKLGRIWNALGILERPEQSPVGLCAYVTVGRRRGQNGTTWPDMVHVSPIQDSYGHTWDSVTIDRWHELGRDKHGYRAPRRVEPVSGVTCPPPAGTEPPVAVTDAPPETIDSGHWPDETAAPDEPDDVREFWSRDVYGHYTYRNDPSNKRL